MGRSSSSDHSTALGKDELLLPGAPAGSVTPIVPAGLLMYQHRPFTRLAAASMPANADLLPLLCDSIGMRHFFAPNYRGVLFLVVRLQDASLPRFPVAALDAGVTVRYVRRASGQPSCPQSRHVHVTQSMVR